MLVALRSESGSDEGRLLETSRTAVLEAEAETLLRSRIQRLQHELLSIGVDIGHDRSGLGVCLSAERPETATEIVEDRCGEIF